MRWSCAGGYGSCCGGGGGQWAEIKIGEPVEFLRTQQAAATGARVVATACPYCKIMLDDVSSISSWRSRWRLEISPSSSMDVRHTDRGRHRPRPRSTDDRLRRPTCSRTHTSLTAATTLLPSPAGRGASVRPFAAARRRHCDPVVVGQRLGSGHDRLRQFR